MPVSRHTHQEFGLTPPDTSDIEASAAHVVAVEPRSDVAHVASLRIVRMALDSA